MKLKIPYWYFLLGPTFLYYLGGFFNMGVMALNHGQMPVQLPANVATLVDFDIRHTVMTSATHLKFFCDWIQLGDGIASPGDVLAWLGDAIMIPCLAIWAAFVIKDYNEGNNGCR